jgi:hypothetical protein
VAGGLIEALGVRAVLVLAGVGGLLVWVLSSLLLRGAWSEPDAEVPTDTREAIRQRRRSAQPERQQVRPGPRRWS